MLNLHFEVLFLFAAEICFPILNLLYIAISIATVLFFFFIAAFDNVFIILKVEL